MKEKYPKTYIIILNYNNWSDTFECLESILRNSYPNYQIIVIDNKSTDKSLINFKEWAEGKKRIYVGKYNPLMSLSYPNIKKPLPFIIYSRLEAENGGNLEKEKMLEKSRDWSKNITTPYPLIFIQNEENLGFAGGNNVGIRYALKKDDFEYIWLLNNDTVIDKNALVELVDSFNYYSKPSIIGSKLLFYSMPNTIQTMCGGVLNPLTMKISPIKRYKNNHDGKDIHLDYISGASMFVSKGFIEDVGFMDELYFMYFEDFDWCQRAKIRKYMINCCCRSCVWHKKEASTGMARQEKSFFKRKSARPSINKLVFTYYYNIRNRIYFVKKYFRNKYLLFIMIYMPIKICRMVLGIFLYNDPNKFKRIGFILRGVYDGITGKMGRRY